MRTNRLFSIRYSDIDVSRGGAFNTSFHEADTVLQNQPSSSKSYFPFFVFNSYLFPSSHKTLASFYAKRRDNGIPHSPPTLHAHRIQVLSHSIKDQ